MNRTNNLIFYFQSFTTFLNVSLLEQIFIDLSSCCLTRNESIYNILYLRLSLKASIERGNVGATIFQRRSHPISVLSKKNFETSYRYVTFCNKTLRLLYTFQSVKCNMTKTI